MGEQIIFEEWPVDTEGRLRLVTSISNKILKESIYEAERDRTENEKCVNIYPKDKDHESRNRIAAIWALKHRESHVLVKKPIFEMIRTKVSTKGIKDPRLENKTEYVYRNITPEEAIIILQIIAKTEY